jgi:uncharacterized membrane protein YhaH (DUF805 family)
MLGFLFGFNARLRRLQFFLATIAVAILMTAICFAIFSYAFQHWPRGTVPNLALAMTLWPVLGTAVLFGWLTFTLYAMRIRDIGWDPVCVIPGWIAVMIIDYLIGEPDQIGRGLGPLMIRSMIERIWRDRPEVTTIMVAVVAANRASWRALEKAGLARVGTGNMEPDNPGDGPEHHIYRIDRGPAAAARTIA